MARHEGRPAGRVPEESEARGGVSLPAFMVTEPARDALYYPRSHDAAARRALHTQGPPMKRLLVSLATVLGLLMPALALAAPAEAAVNKKSCTSAREYSKITRKQTTAKVKSLVGNNGKTRSDLKSNGRNPIIYEGNGRGDYVYDHQNYAEFIYVGPNNGDSVVDENEGWDSDGDGIDDEWPYFEYVGAAYARLTFHTQIRKYTSCRGFNGGRPTYVWFNNFSNGTGLRVLGKYRSDPLAGGRKISHESVFPTGHQGTFNGRNFVFGGG